MQDESQIFYGDQWHEKSQFRCWVQNARGDRFLCNNWETFSMMTQDQGWHDPLSETKPKAKKSKNKD